MYPYFIEKRDRAVDHPSKQQLQQVLDEILNYRCPRYDQLPAFPMYSDQVIELLNNYTTPFRSPDSECAITPTMINNYVKQHLIPAPVKKRYLQEHVARLYCICVLKHAFTVAEIARLLDIQTKSYPFPVAYDYFCVELEKSLRATFSTRDFSAPSSASRVTGESELVRSSALSFANKMFSIKFLEYYGEFDKKTDPD